MHWLISTLDRQNEVNTAHPIEIRTFILQTKPTNIIGYQIFVSLDLALLLTLL